MLRTSLHRIRELTIILFAACIAYIFHYSFSLIGIGDVCALFEQNCSEYKITYLENCVKPKEKKEELQQNLSVISREYFHYLASHLKDTPYPGITKYIYYTSAELQLKPLKNVKPLKSGFNLIFNDIQNFNYLLEMFPCTKKKQHSLSFLVVVISAPNHFDKRKIIRETWLRKLKIQSNLKSLTMSGFGFIVGLTEDRNTKMRIKGESDLYGDILQINMVDNYYNLTLKTAGLINWIHNRCSKVDFVVKVDDDVFINVQNLISLIKILDPSEKTIYGSAADSIPLRNKKNGKHYISIEHWPWSSFPPYLKGAAIIFPGIIIESLLAAIQTTPYFPFDDVYLTGLCSSKAGIKLLFSERISVGYSTNYLEVPRPCQVYNSITWVTQSMLHFNLSYWATENLYQNLTKCVNQSSFLFFPNN